MQFYDKRQIGDEMLAQCAAHATKDHNMKPEEITEDLKSKIKSNTPKSWF